MLNTQSIHSYLARIKTPFQKEPTLSYLNKLHRNHLLNIPFENLDIWMNNQIILDVNKLFDKVIIRRRGGFCYELNGLFSELLQSLGYEVKLVSGKVYDSNQVLGPEFDHAAIIVKIDGKDILVDVGFGDSFSSPKMIQPQLLQMDYNRYFKIEKNIDGEYLLLKSDDSFTFEKQYLFTKEAHQFIEFIDMCHYHQSNPKSPFKRKKLITQAKPDGRVTLTQSKLIRTTLGKKEEEAIINHDDFCVKLHQHFGILFRITR
ncbi:MAG: arylamine N-acetyltransferase [Reichenbachiella sp.]